MLGVFWLHGEGFETLGFGPEEHFEGHDVDVEAGYEAYWDGGDEGHDFLFVLMFGGFEERDLSDDFD